MTTAINLAELSAPKLISELSYEDILSETLQEFKAKDVSYSSIVESDPVYKILEVSAYREYMYRQYINDEVRGLLLAYAIGSDLDHLAAHKNIKRKENETDTALRIRVQLAPEGYSVAGPSGAYEFHALSAHDSIKDVKAISPAPAEVKVIILSHLADGTAGSEIIDAVEAIFRDEEVRPLTDLVTIQSASIVNYNITASLKFFNGPDREVVMNDALKAIEDFVTDQHRIGRDITLSAIHAALHRAGVQNVVVTEPATDITITSEQAAFCSNIVLTDGGIHGA